MKGALLAVAILTRAPTAPEPAVPHDLAIRAFASTLAIMKMASDRWPDILIDQDLVRRLGQAARFVRERDAPLLADEARAVSKTLAQAIAEAPSVQAWCDVVYRLYGPDGKMIPGLMLRDRSHAP